MDKRLGTAFFEEDLAYLSSVIFLELCRNTPEAFTRKRKMTLRDVLASILNNKGRTLHMELREVMKIVNPETTISKAAYHKQRMKLNPGALEALYKFHVTNFYHHDDVSPHLLNGHLLLAADGTKINLSKTEETFDQYGQVTSDGTEVIRIGFECLYDVLNRFIIDCNFNDPFFDEIKAVEKLLDKVRDTVGNKYPIIVTMDRAYPSIPFMLNLVKKDIHFVIRLASTDYKEEQKQLRDSGRYDDYISLSITPERKSFHKGTRNEKTLKKDNRLLVRFIRITLSTGEEEVLITDLPVEDFPYESFKELYHYRWGIETTFFFLKGHLQMENFSGTRLTIIYQDIFATLYLHNLGEHMLRDVESAQEERLQNAYKHPMKINRNISYGLLKEELIHIILEPNNDKKAAMMHALYEEMSKNLVPVREGRSFPRKARDMKYSNTHKRSF